MTTNANPNHPTGWTDEYAGYATLYAPEVRGHWLRKADTPEGAEVTLWADGRYTWATAYRSGTETQAALAFQAAELASGTWMVVR